MLRLIDKATQQVLNHVAEDGWFTLPNGDRVSPAVVGWETDAYMLVEVPPAPTPTPEEVLAEVRQNMRLSFAQLLTGLVMENWITQAEGQAWLQGVLPAAVMSLIDTLPSEQQFAAIARATVPSAVNRMDPLVIQLGAAQGKTPEELDTFFQTYANV